MKTCNMDGKCAHPELCGFCNTIVGRHQNLNVKPYSNGNRSKVETEETEKETSMKTFKETVKYVIGEINSRREAIYEIKKEDRNRAGIITPFEAQYGETK